MLNIERLAGRFLVLAALVLLPGLAFAQVSPSAFTSATRYDAARRVTGTIAPLDGVGGTTHQAARNSYDPAGRLTKVETGYLTAWQSTEIAPRDWSGFVVLTRLDTTYDAMNRKTLEIASGGGVSTATQYSYNDQGLLECTAVRMNPVVYGSLPASACALGIEGGQGPDRIMRNEYDAAGQLLKVQKAYATALQQDYVTYTYWPNGTRKSVKDANGNLANLEYDGYDRLLRWRFPSKTSVGSVSADDYEEYGYDANGNRTSVRRRDGRMLTFAYDALNRMTSKIVPDGCAPIQVGGCAPATATRDVYYGYDLRGLQTYARFDSPSGEGITNSYTGFGELASSTTAMGGYSRTISSTYDANGVRVRVTHPDGQFINYNHDGLDRLYYTQLGGGGGLFHTPHDNAGRLAALYRITSSTANWGAQTSYGYDGVNRLTSLAHAIGGAGVTSSFTYNPASQMTRRSRDNDAYAFTGYVPINRAYGVNGLNQYTSGGPATFAYDANGNLTSDRTTDRTTGYVYDAENRLVSASTGATLTYDPLGRLWQTAGGAAGVTQFLYDGDQLTAEYNGSGAMLRRYVHSEGEDDPQVWFEGSGTGSPRYLYADHQGSIVGVTDANGTMTRINAYDEYGIPKAGNDVTTSGRFQYTGQAWIPELGMYYYKARIYSPNLGRFLQTDPIGYEDQINLYAYVANDPVNGRDPTGTQTVPGATIPSFDDWRRIVGDAWEAVKNDPGIVLDAAMIVADVATVPSGEAAAGIALRRTAREAGEAATRREAGVVYRRTNTDTGRCYIGRCNSDELFARRQRDHDRRVGTRHEYEVVERAKPGRPLREAEQRQIDAHGGPKNRNNPNGGTENRRNEIAPCRRTQTGNSGANGPC